VEDVALQGEVGVFALALDADEARVFEFLHVMGESGGADGLRFCDAAAGCGALAAADFGEDFVAARLGQGLRNEGELAIGEADGFAGALFCHRFYLNSQVDSMYCRRRAAEAGMFEQYSDRARWVVFLSRKIAGRRGAAEIGVEDLIESLVVEDQGDFAKVFSEGMASGVQVQRMSEHQPFFTVETAAAIRGGLKPMLASEGEALADSVDMPLTSAAKAVLEGAQKLSEDLHQNSGIAAHIGPLHLVAATLADESSEIAKILKHAGVGREAVIAAIRSGQARE
jgi:hypothetical protein